MENKTEGTISRFIKKNSRVCAILSIVLCGIFIVGVSFIPKSTEKEKSALSDDGLDSYTRSLEQRLSDTVSQIDGAGKVSVFITMESSFETVYASNARLDEQSNDSNSVQKTTEKQLATTSSTSSGESPVIVKQLSPKIKGVLIVCEGGENPKVRQNILSASSVALNIQQSRIYVTGGKYSQ